MSGPNARADRKLFYYVSLSMFRSYAIQHIGRLVVVVVAFPTESKCFAHKITYILQMNSFSAESTGDVMVIASEKKLTV